MNFWTGLILGIIIGWLVEWIIDWLFWRRDAEEAREAELLAETKTGASLDLQADWEQQLGDAEQEYQSRLQAVEEEWQSRLNLNEQQWQSQFTVLEADNSDLRGRLAALTAAGAVGAILAHESADDDVVLIDETLAEAGNEYFDDVLVDNALVEDANEWEAGQIIIEPVTSDLESLGDMDGDLSERLRLAGVNTVDELAAADPTTLSVTTGLERGEADAWISRAAAFILAAQGLADEPAEDAIGPSVEVTYRDDLTRVHGIGPRYAALLAAEGITSYDDLAAASPHQLRAAVNPGPMQQINFNSWAAQAAALAGTRSVRVGDDLTDLEGIGPVYATRLRESGITSFAQLAETDESALAEIIGAPAWRRINYGDWIAQARLAAGGDEAGLRDLQSRLHNRGSDNLSLIHGMGERSATALQAAGIATFADLAGESPQRLEAVMREAGVRGNHDYETWITEAGLRASGKRVPSTRTRAIHIVPCPQDLSVVDGIGPVFEERLYNAGIGSYWSLAELPRAELIGILGERATHTADLDAIQKSAMQVAAATNSLGRSWDGTPPDDFDGLPEIGEIYERRLYEAGICTYEAMAATTPERLAEICQAPSMRTPDYAIWIAQAAELAASRSG